MDESVIVDNLTTMALNTTLGQQCTKKFLLQHFYDFLQMFYILFPSEEVHEKSEDVPSYEVNLIPMISVFVVLEQFVRLIQQKPFTRLPDFITNIGSAVIFTFARVLFLGSMIHVYVFLWDHYRVVDMPLHSLWTWFVSVLLVEFVYYWTHRALHEFNILWAAHQFHHMAEDLNVTTAIRDSIVDLIIYDIFPLPLAILIPPPVLVVHMQFSLIYQVWLHNSVVPNLGFIEYIINTPRQHLVHHGKNPYCIDKNYGALLLIYDRIFGTYQRELKENELVFGVVSPTPDTFDPMILQFGYYRDVFKKFMSMDNWQDRMSALLKGPGWSPGKPRLGLISDVPEPDRSLPKYSFDPPIPTWAKLYVSFHMLAILIALYEMGDHELIKFSYSKAMVAMGYLIMSLTSFGFIFDYRKFAPIFEVLRCLMYFLFDYYIVISTPWSLDGGQKVVFDVMLTVLRIFYTLSVVFWLFFCFCGYSCSSPVVGHKACELESNEKCSGENGDTLADIDTVKKRISKESSRLISTKNLIASIFFIIFGAIAFEVVYFLNVDECAQLMTESMKH